MLHLQKLAQAGLSHLHLMPFADFTTVQEDRSQQVDAADSGTGAAADSEAQQAALALAMGKDAFDWGYDPYHYNAPEGSYAADPKRQRPDSWKCAGWCRAWPRPGCGW